MHRQQLWRIALLAATALLCLCAAWPAPGAAAPTQQRPTVGPSPTQGAPRPTLAPEPGSTPTLPEPAARPATICLRLAADGAVGPGEVATYRLVAQNRGRGAARAVQLAFVYSPNEQALLDAAFSAPGAWVTALRADAAELSLGPMGPGATITATLRTLIRPTTPLGRGLSTRAELHWSDGTGDKAGRSNRLDITVGLERSAGSTVPLAVAPAQVGPAASFSVENDGFAANEDVSLWYHEPGGRAVALDQARSDAQGRLALSLAARSLPPGRLPLVAYGQCSQATAVGEILVAHE